MSPATVPTARIGAREIAERLGLHAPTAEQRAVIEADPFGASIVVAGAGSGKTETMANRVVWMLANGHVTVPDVLDTDRASIQADASPSTAASGASPMSIACSR